MLFAHFFDYIFDSESQQHLPASYINNRKLCPASIFSSTQVFFYHSKQRSTHWRPLSCHSCNWLHPQLEVRREPTAETVRLTVSRITQHFDSKDIVFKGTASKPPIAESSIPLSCRRPHWRRPKLKVSSVPTAQRKTLTRNSISRQLINKFIFFKGMVGEPLTAGYSRPLLCQSAHWLHPELEVSSKSTAQRPTLPMNSASCQIRGHGRLVHESQPVSKQANKSKRPCLSPWQQPRRQSTHQQMFTIKSHTHASRTRP